MRRTVTSLAHLAARIDQTLRITLSERPLQIDRLNTLAPCVAENRERRVLPIVAVMMRPVRQSIMIADQVAMNRIPSVSGRGAGRE